jgi:hypothetical protein
MSKCVAVAGDGEFEFPVVGESHHQRFLEQLCGGRTRWSAHHYCTANLIPESHNPHDPHAVAVTICGVEVGYLPRHMAPDLIEALQEVDADEAQCNAIVVGGWHRPGAEDGFFGVKLDATYPVRFVRPDSAEAQTSATPWWRRLFGNLSPSP